MPLYFFVARMVYLILTHHTKGPVANRHIRQHVFTIITYTRVRTIWRYIVAIRAKYNKIRGVRFNKFKLIRQAVNTENIFYKIIQIQAVLEMYFYNTFSLSS